MPNCIYCNSEGPFNKEHVFPYFLGGGGDGWTLIDTVCKDCNNIFSALERALARHSIESIPRTFFGPKGRHAKKKRQIPLYSEDLYYFFEKDDLIYEAGLEIGFQPYLRPQIIEVSYSQFTITGSDYSEIEKLIESVKSFAEKELFITIKTPTKKGELFEILELKLNGENVTINDVIKSEKPKGVWFRTFSENFDLKKKRPTTRIYIDDDNKLIIKSADISKSMDFIFSLLKMIYNNEELSNHVKIKNTLKKNIEPTSSEIALRISVKIEFISRAIAKIGLNFIAKLYGIDFVLNPEFNEIKKFILGEIHNTFEESELHVKPIGPNTSPFQQIPFSDDRHYLFSAYNDKNGLVFGLNLYGGKGGYLAKLGNIKPPQDENVFRFATINYSERKTEILS
jgi:hypothetical protein